MFDACHIIGIGTMQIAIRMCLGIEWQQAAAGNELADKFFVFGSRAVAPMHPIRLRERSNFIHPAGERG
jgi:hypothetical protein